MTTAKRFEVGDRVAGDWPKGVGDGYERVYGTFNGIANGYALVRVDENFSYRCAPNSISRLKKREKPREWWATLDTNGEYGKLYPSHIKNSDFIKGADQFRVREVRAKRMRPEGL